MKKWMVVVLTVACIVSMISLPAGTPPNAVQAQHVVAHKAFLPSIRETAWLYMPFIRFMEPILFDDFEDQDPAWEYMLPKDPKDGFFEHMNGKYLGHIQDNSAVMLATPGWRASGDFKLEVDGRHLEPDKKSANGLGIAFNANDEWNGFYSMIIAAGGAQHLWSVVRWTGTRGKSITNNGYRGGPGSMKNWSGTNHLMVVRIGDTIRPYCNGRALPTGDGRTYVVDDTYGPGGLVGLIVTSYEFSDGEIDFDNFQLTPLYEEDIGEYVSEEQEFEPYEFDTPPIQLHE